MPSVVEYDEVLVSHVGEDLHHNFAKPMDRRALGCRRDLCDLGTIPIMAGKDLLEPQWFILDA